MASAPNSAYPNIQKNNAKITLKVENADRSECHSSPTTEIGGFKWHLEMRKIPNDHPRSSALHIFCVSENDSTTDTVEKLWLCKAYVRIRSKFSYGIFSRPKSEQFHFFNGNTCQKWDDDLFLCSNSPEIEMKVSVKNLNLSMPLETDLQLLFNGKEKLVAVNKFALATFSSYFRNLFFGDWSEQAGTGNKDKFIIIEEENIDLNAFKLMLYSAMAFGNFVEQGNFLEAQTALSILKLSVKYDFPMLRDYCQEFLMKPYANCAKMEMLEAAEQLGLLKLKDYCLAKITPLNMARDFGRNNEIYARLSKQTQQRLDKQLSECAEEMADDLHDAATYGYYRRDMVMEE